MNSLYNRFTIILFIIMILGCASPKQIEQPDVRNLSSRIGENTIDEIVIKAAVLDKEQTITLFNTDMEQRCVIPILFVVTNKSKVGCEIRREHFKAHLGISRIEPAMPGRAAALLRDPTGSMTAAWAGYILFGFLVAPSIDAADKAESAAIEEHRKVIFSSGHIPPGGSISGYLLFESPISLKSIKLFDLEYYLAGSKNKLTVVQLTNPYAGDINN
jgi:hypothetical protein